MFFRGIIHRYLFGSTRFFSWASFNKAAIAGVVSNLTFFVRVFNGPPPNTSSSVLSSPPFFLSFFLSFFLRFSGISSSSSSFSLSSRCIIIEPFSTCSKNSGQIMEGDSPSRNICINSNSIS